MLVRRYRFAILVGSAVLALFVIPAPDARAQQVGLSNIRGLDFGRFVAGSGGTVVLTPGGLRSRTGAVVLLHSPNAGQAGFNVNRVNDDKTAVGISMPPNGSIRLNSGANSMAVDSFVSSPASTMSIQTPQVLSVGATLTVAPNQAPGNYSGTFSVTVNYQ